MYRGRFRIAATLITIRYGNLDESRVDHIASGHTEPAHHSDEPGTLALVVLVDRPRSIDARGEDGDAVFPGLHAAPEFAPSVEPGHASRLGTLRRNEPDIVL